MWICVRPYRMPIFTSPGAFGAPQEDIDVEGLSGWWVDAPREDLVVVLAHGYYLNRSELAPVAFWLWQQGIPCVLFDFRAHGKSKGGACSFGWRERADVAAVARFARSKRPEAKVVAIGSSMGSVASAFAWAEDPSLLDGLVLDSAYSKLNRAILGWWRFVGRNALAVILSPTVFLGGFLAWVNPFKIDVTEALTKLQGKPVLVLHGACDQVAPKKEVERNLQALGTNQITWFDDCDHSEGRWEQPDRYHAVVGAFLAHLGQFR